MGLIEAFATTVTVTRPGAVTNVRGTLTPGAATTLTVRAAVMPLRPQELLNLPEAQRTREAIRLYSETELRTANEAVGTPADVVAYQGRAYEVQQAEAWMTGGLPHWKAIAVKKDA